MWNLSLFRETSPRPVGQGSCTHLGLRLAWLAAPLLALSSLGCANRPPRISSSFSAKPIEYSTPTVEGWVAPFPNVTEIATNEGAGNFTYDESPPSELVRRPYRPLNEASFREVTLEEIHQLALKQGSVLRDLGGTLVATPLAAATAWDSHIIDLDPVFGSQGALSEFDALWSNQVGSSNNDRVFNNITLGGGATELKQDLLTNRTAISKRNWTGAVWEFGQSTSYDNNNRFGNLFPSSWDSQLDVGVRKPMLRGAGREFNAIAGPNARPGFNFANGVWIANLNTQISQADFAARIDSYLSQVEDAYWQLHLAYQQWASAKENLASAERVYLVVRAKFENGLEGGEADREAEARGLMLRFRQLVNQASVGAGTARGVVSSELALRQLVGLPVCDDTYLKPSSRLPKAPISHDWSMAVANSRETRPELIKQRLVVRQEELKLIASKNFELPQADLVGRYRARGFGDDLTGSSSRFASSWKDLGSMDHQEWDFGIEVDAPVGRRQARVGVQSARLKLARAHALLVEQERAIDFAIADAMAKSQSAYESVQILEAAMDAARARLGSTEAQFSVDRIPLDRLRESQENFQLLSDQLESARVEYARTLKEVARQSGNYLHDLHVYLSPS
jgi:outer membrane protein TolC